MKEDTFKGVTNIQIPDINEDKIQVNGKVLNNSVFETRCTPSQD